MDAMQSKVDDFLQLVLRNLQKNGFPEKAVSFPLDKMFESASQRGFSFNKIRTLLEQQNIATELTNTHVIFRAEAAAEPEFDYSAMATAAQELIAKLTPEQRMQMEKMMQDMKTEDMEALKRQWESLPSDEKLRMMQDIPK